MADGDQSGRFAQQARVYRGPTLGWSLLDIFPERFVAGTPAAVQPGDSVILLTGTAQTVTLPDVTQWVLDAYDQGANRSAFSRALEIIDYGGLASDASRHTLTPFGGQTINGLASWQMISPFTVVRLRPLSSLAGWFIA